MRLSNPTPIRIVRCHVSLLFDVAFFPMLRGVFSRCPLLHKKEEHHEETSTRKRGTWWRSSLFRNTGSTLCLLVSSAFKQRKSRDNSALTRERSEPLSGDHPQRHGARAKDGEPAVERFVVNSHPVVRVHCLYMENVVEPSVPYPRTRNAFLPLSKGATDSDPGGAVDSPLRRRGRLFRQLETWD